MSEPTECQEVNDSDGSKSFGRVPTVAACRSPLAGTSSEEVAGNGRAHTSVETEKNTDILQHEEQCSQQTTDNSQPNETLDSGLSPISCTDFDMDESVMNFRETDGLSSISSIDFDQYDSMDFQQNEASVFSLSDISSTDLDEYVKDHKQCVTFDYELSNVSSTDLSGQDTSHQKQETHDSGLNTTSGSRLTDPDRFAMNRRQNEMDKRSMQHLIDIYGSVSGLSTTSCRGSFDLNKSIPQSSGIIKNAFYEKFLTRDAFQSLKSPRPTCSYITPEEEAIKSRRINDDLNSTCPVSEPDAETKQCDIQLQDDTSDVSEEEFTDTLFQQTKRAFTETGEHQHIRRWSLEQIETELVQFKDDADIERAKLVCRGKIVDKELKQLNRKLHQPKTENKLVDEERKDEKRDEGAGIIDVNKLQDS